MAQPNRTKPLLSNSRLAAAAAAGKAKKKEDGFDIPHLDRFITMHYPTAADRAALDEDIEGLEFSENEAKQAIKYSGYAVNTLTVAAAGVSGANLGIVSGDTYAENTKSTLITILSAGLLVIAVGAWIIQKVCDPIVEDRDAILAWLNAVRDHYDAQHPQVAIAGVGARAILNSTGAVATVGTDAANLLEDGRADALHAANDPHDGGARAGASRTTP